MFIAFYDFRLVVDSTTEQVKEITQMVQSHVPDAALARSHGKEIAYTLPLDAVSKFPGEPRS